MNIPAIPASLFIPDPEMITLEKHNHETPEDGVCLMEAVAWWVGEPHNDHPQCVDPKLANLGRNLNDTMLDHYRTGFAKLIPALAGTRTQIELTNSRSLLMNKIGIETLHTLLKQTGHDIEPRNDTNMMVRYVTEVVEVLKDEISPPSSLPNVLTRPLIYWAANVGVPQKYINPVLAFIVKQDGGEDAFLDAQDTLAKGYEALVLDPEGKLAPEVQGDEEGAETEPEARTEALPGGEAEPVDEPSYDKTAVLV